MNTETYNNRIPMMPEPNTEAYIPHFPWTNPGNFFSARNVGLPFPANDMEPKPGMTAIPIRSFSPMTEPVNHTNSETKPTKSKKKKSTAKQSKKKPSASRHPGIKVERKNQNVFFNEAKLDLSAVPPPYCSCTGVARICYKNGPGGWQSSCCTTKISEYPLPMSSLRPGARVGGRKMTRGAYTNLLYRLVSEGHDISYPVDLKDHWARLGSNKFVTIK